MRAQNAVRFMYIKLFLCILLNAWLLILPAQADMLPSSDLNGSQHQHTDPAKQTPTLDLRQASWGQAEEFKLDGLWHAYWGAFVDPAEIYHTELEPFLFPVPGVWSDQPRKKNRHTLDSFFIEQHAPEGEQLSENASKVLPALGFMTYHAKVLLPNNLGDVFLYIPDMPSAYKLFVNGIEVARNGETGYFQNTEKPGFLPKVVRLSHQGELDLVIHLSNFHYREGGIWFSLRLTDETGYFAMAQQPVISAVFFAAILIAIGLYNFSFFAFRSKEVAALYFGLLCLTVGIRRLLIDERVLYLFDWFDWATLQRIEHLCFYLSLPLFMSFFTTLYRKHIPANIPKISWILISPFVVICLIFTNRIYTELNLPFQVLVLISMSFAILMYIQVVRAKGKQVKVFGISLGILLLTVIHDVLKANGLVGTNVNIAHFGVLAFIIAQSIALQRTYLKSLDLVEAMSRQLKTRNKELVEMDAFKDEFLATTSHELRTPLQGIAGLAKVLQDDANEHFSPDQKSKISLIAKTTQRLSILVNDILDFSAIKHGKIKLNRSTTDLKALAELTLSTVSPLLRNKDIRLSASIAEDARFIKVDEFRFQQILINVTGNAVKYTERGFIELASYTTSEHLIIEISDSGVGIPFEKRQSLFRPFEQTHVEGHLTASGTGLGLSISKQLVELHGGHLEINSQVGKGTTVTITLPMDILTENTLPPTTLASDQSSQRAPEYEHNAITSSQPETVNQDYSGMPQDSGLSDKHTDNGPLIYIVDDEAVNRELLASLLLKQGYRVEQFTDGISALTGLTHTLPDLILLDFMMPRMSGLEVCQCIRKQYDSYELPVMMITARHLIQDIVSALGAGANDYLIKPYHDQELIARVKSQLSVRQYWIANRENQKLKTEIKRREALEDELSELNMRLLNVLDISTEMILLINEKLQIVYANELANNLLQNKNQAKGNKSLLGQNIQQFIDVRLAKLLLDALNNEDQALINTETIDEQAGLIWQATIKRFHQDQNCFLALMMQSKPINEPSPAKDALAKLTRELSESRQKIHDIESTLRHVLIQKDSDESPDHHGISISHNRDDEDKSYNEPVATDQRSADLPSVTDTGASTEDPKEAIVSLLRHSLNIWEQHTNKGKVELAEQSRCWRVYVDGTTVKTRTFDKYLSTRSIPARPRWRAVVRTANFVVANCPLSEQEKTLLNQLSTQVENLYS